MEEIGIFGPFGPNLDTVNTNTQHQLGFEYIRDARYVFQGSRQEIGHAKEIGKKMVG